MTAVPFFLTSVEPTFKANLSFVAHQCLIENNTARWLYLRLGGSDFPTRESADVSVPPYTARFIPVRSTTFSGTLSAITSIEPEVGVRCIITFYPFGESASIGGLDFIGLASADNVPNYPLTYSTITPESFALPLIDLLSWSGIILSVRHNAYTPLIVQVRSTDNDGSPYLDVGSWAVLDGSIYIPRMRQFAEILLTTPPVLTDGSYNAVIHARRVLEEIQWKAEADFRTVPALTLVLTAHEFVNDRYIVAQSPYTLLEFRVTSQIPTANIPLKLYLSQPFASGQEELIWSDALGPTRLIVKTTLANPVDAFYRLQIDNQHNDNSLPLTLYMRRVLTLPANEAATVNAIISPAIDSVTLSDVADNQLQQLAELRAIRILLEAQTNITLSRIDIQSLLEA